MVSASKSPPSEFLIKTVLTINKPKNLPFHVFPQKINRQELNLKGPHFKFSHLFQNFQNPHWIQIAILFNPLFLD